jgi:hypothetical protein
MSGKGVPEDVKSRVLGLHEDNVQLREQLKTVQDKLTKARTVWNFLLSIHSFPLFIVLCSSSSNHRISSLKRSRLNYGGSHHP